VTTTVVPRVVPTAPKVVFTELSSDDEDMERILVCGCDMRKISSPNGKMYVILMHVDALPTWKVSRECGVGGMQ